MEKSFDEMTFGELAREWLRLRLEQEQEKEPHLRLIWPTAT